MKKETEFLNPILDGNIDIRFLEIHGSEEIHFTDPTLLLSTDSNSETRIGFFIRSLKTGDLSIISGNTTETIHSEPGSFFIQVTFRNLPDFYLDLRIAEKPEKEKMIKFSIYSLLQNNLIGCPTSEAINRAYVSQLITLSADKTGQPSLSKRKNLDLFRDMLLFISRSQSENLTMNSVSRQYGYTPQYFSLFFKRSVGLNFQQFYDAVRVNTSLHDLVQSDDSLEDIAVRNGFSEYRSYVRAFRSLFDLTPNDYRQSGCPFRICAQHCEDKAVSEFISSFCQYENLSTDPELNGYEKKKIVKTDYGLKGRTIRPTYLTMVRIHEAADLLKYNVVENLTDAVKDIGFRLVALPDIFSERLPISISIKNGKKTLSFPFQDKVIDHVLEANLRPFIILSEPKNENGTLPEWTELISQFIDHLLKRYSYESVLPLVFSYNPQRKQAWDQISLLHYQQAHKILKDISQAILFGSPELYLLDRTMENEMKFVHFAEEHNCIPDFYNLKFFNGEIEGDDTYSHLSSSPNFLHDYLSKIRAIPQFANQRIFITALDFTSHEDDYLNDTLYSSSFFIKNVLESLELAESFSKTALLDHQKTPLLQANTFHGGRGLMTSSGIRKANYYAYRFLSRLDTTLLAQGEGYLITKGYNKITILLYHMATFTDTYLQNGYKSIPEDNRYEAFTKPTNERYILTIHGLGKHTEARIKTSVINRKAGSSYDLFHDNGNVEIHTPESLDAVKSLTIPRFTLSEKEIEDGELVIRENVDSLEAKLLEITLK